MGMDSSYIAAFMHSIQNVFSTMLQLQVRVGEARVKTDAGGAYDVSGIIGLSGDVVGSVVLSLPRATGERIVALFTGEELALGSPDFADAVGELVNMIAGGAKGRFENRKVSISCPSVILGASHKVATQRDTPCIVIPCASDCGEMVIEVCMQDRRAHEGAGAWTGAAAA